MPLVCGLSKACPPGGLIDNMLLALGPPDDHVITDFHATSAWSYSRLPQSRLTDKLRPAYVLTGVPAVNSWSYRFHAANVGHTDSTSPARGLTNFYATSQWPYNIPCH